MYFGNFISKKNFQQGSTVVLDQGFYSITNFLTGILLARSISKEAYGIYVLALSLLLSLLGVQRAMITVPYTVYFKKHEQVQQQEYTGSVFVHQIVLLAFTLFISLGFSRYFFSSSRPFPEIFFSLASFSIVVVGFLWRDFVRFYCLATLKIWQSILLGFLTNSFQLTLLWILFITKNLTIYNAFFATGSSIIIITLVFFLANVRIKICVSRIISDFLANFKLSKWIFGSNIMYILSSQIYPWLLGFFSGKASVAVFGVVISLASLPNPLAQGINAFIFPKMVHSKTHNPPFGIIKIIRKTIIVLSLFSALWLMCGVFFGNRLLVFLYSSKYAGYGVILVMLIINNFISIITGPVNAALDTLERSDVSFASLIVAFFVTIIAGTLFINFYGIIGAALGMILANLTTSLLRWKGLYKIIGPLKVMR